MFDNIFITTALLGLGAFVLFACIKSSKNGSAKSTNQYLAHFSQKKPVILKRRTQLNHDTLLLTFSFMNGKQVLGLDVGQHIRV